MTGHDHSPGAGQGAHLHGLEALSVPAGKLHAGASPFAELMGEVMATAERFGHRQHIQLTWLAVRRYGTSAAVDLVSDGIQRTARYAGAPQKYNATVSRAWVEVVGHHAGRSDTVDFNAFADRNPALFDKKLLTRFYRSSTLASDLARHGWVEPDLAPFPWQQAAS
ncbi:hypothetical protein ACFQFC_24075 [Amorphoplanes digitatis]|uniref:Uncharacterized protein n=1 Tax=Actinoplanes digitatis TaxID=1868 RepID=A0A7W7MV05_9ACTN|nr:hypothetical protein [Actinoplanes digitatis]MBB4767300.1 hypothetical protein [Actinoplanes digitatis]BFE66966.1 hypothetical protein GCM10020092_002670 [Actinoplanes digitatis]GID98274.1 hypothetical protein Adi01nite_76860 [Actinoplanes digitatis]